MALLGQVGSGKTHLLMAVSNNLLSKGIQVRYFEFVEEFNDLKSDFNRFKKKIDRLKEVEVLFIDDLFKGREHPTAFEATQMFGIINYRYLNKKPILISSEHTIDSLVEIDEAIGSRIFEMCHDFIVQIKGDLKELNYRLKDLKFL
jgi:DNA replication protein DnaC